VEFRAALATALEYGDALGCRRLHAMAGIPGDEADPEEVADTFADNLVFAAAEASAKGVDILIEPINTRDIPGYYLNYVEDAAAIIARVGAPNLKLQFDIYHRQIMSGDVMMGMAACLPLIGHVQTAGVPDRNEPTTGELDDVRVLHFLDELGYAGWVGCEYRPKAGTVAGLKWLKKVK
jgi:hydroxypyruvate isomerase